MTRRSIFVVGTRAQLVKMAPVLRVAVERGMDHRVLFTGQHRESIDDLVCDFELESAFDMPDGHSERSSIWALLKWVPSAFIRCVGYLRRVRLESGSSPVVIVHGDTLSALLGAVAARTVRAPVVHVESGLASGRLFDPFPEEMIRRLVFRFVTVAVCPNDAAFERMKRSGGCKSVHSGENTLLDSTRFALRKSRPVHDLPARYFVASIHRFANIYSPARLGWVVDQLIALAGVSTVVVVLHPATEKRLHASGLWSRLNGCAGVRLVPRMPYTDFLSLLSGAELVVTDGGSNQEELSYLGVLTVLMRENTERPDGLGANVLFEREIGADLASFVASGKVHGLRRPASTGSTVQPSSMTLDAICELAG